MKIIKIGKIIIFLITRYNSDIAIYLRK